ncbi:hypothetical protein [Sorangium atrum]|uniref:Uncharacterized protein n=1 Tax=Sorangium atrum TaxID=2995308 RepID=A0ABT5BXU7_9BACT|nr:hypothetical protein [Sorangium aterium]MDC0678430.1 hypothetical protein [Sorangium aterium]
MRGKRVLIRGATSDIGKETARSLAMLGADIVLISRNAAKSASYGSACRQPRRTPRANG